MVSLDKVKKYLRLDEEYTDEDGEIEDLIIAAEMYINTSLDYEMTLDNKLFSLYELAVKILAAHWYENREPIGKVDLLAYSLGSIILKLQYGSG